LITGENAANLLKRASFGIASSQSEAPGPRQSRMFHGSEPPTASAMAPHRARAYQG
jgi:hypothetical protein